MNQLQTEYAPAERVSVEEIKTENHRTIWTYIVIAIVALALVFESGVLLGKHQKIRKKNSAQRLGGF